jgi:hypothetical protein
VTGPPRSPAGANDTANRGAPCSHQSRPRRRPPPRNHRRPRRRRGRRRRSWRDVPMQKNGDGWEIELPLAEVGFFKAKAYLLDEKNWQHWPDGPDVGISPSTPILPHRQHIYCAFTRLFGATKNLSATRTKNLNATQVRSTRKVTPHSAVGKIPRPHAPVAAHRPHARLPHHASAARASRRRRRMRASAVSAVRTPRWI